MTFRSATNIFVQSKQSPQQTHLKTRALMQLKERPSKYLVNFCPRAKGGEIAILLIDVNARVG